MLRNTYYLKAQNLQRSSLETTDIRMLINQAQIDLGYYLSQGYKLYNVTANANSFSNLAGLPSGYYICVFTTPPSGTYNLYASYVSPHSKVIVTSMVVDTYNQIQSFGNLILKNNASTDSWDNVEFRHGNFKFSTNNILHLRTTYAIIDLNGLSAYGNINVDKSKITCSTSSNIVLGTDTSTTIDPTIQNSIIAHSTASSQIVFSVLGSLNKGWVFKNCIFKSAYFRFTYNLASTYVYADFTNCKFRDCSLFINASISRYSYGNTIYFNTITFGATTANLPNYVFLYDKRNDNDFVTGYDTLNTASLLTTTNYSTYSVAVIPSREITNGALGSIKYSFDKIQFKRDRKIPDTLKWFDEDDYMVIHREQEENGLTSDGATLLPALFATSRKKIKDFTFYENDGTTPISYRNDESFLIIVYDTVNYGLLAYHQKQIRNTAYFELSPGVTYTIERIIRILRPPSNVELRNMYPCENSQIEGTINYRDITSDIIIR